MRIATRFNLLFTVTALMLCCAMTGYVAQREYQMALNKVVENSLAMVLSRPDLQFHIYSRDDAKLKKALDEFLTPAEVSLAVVYNNQSKSLAIKNQSSTAAAALPTLQFIRSSAAVAETSLTALDIRNEPTSTGYWTSLFDDEPLIHLSTPVLSAINPGTRGKTLLDFVAALSEPELKNSLLVIGYVQLGIERGALLDRIRPTVRAVFFTGLGFVLLGAIGVYLVTRQIFAPLSKLSDMARIISGEVDKRKSGSYAKTKTEFYEIEKVLQSALAGAASREEEVELEHKLLALQADENASKLFAQDEELSQATAEITATKEQLHRLANYDRLTALPNRNLFSEQLALLLRLSARDAKPLAVFCLNLDNFNRVNESLGRSAGDELLKEIAGRLENCLRSSDMLSHNVDEHDNEYVSRLGGDEFAMVVNRLDNANAAAIIAQRVIDALLEPITIEGHDMVVAPCLGIAMAPRDGTDVEALLRAASTAMQHTRTHKQQGFTYFQKDMEATGQNDIRLESDLRKAIERQELHLHYQPQVDTANGSIMCAEALLRWEHPEFGDITPFKFVPMAEKMGLIGQLGEWVLAEACRQMKALIDEGLELPRMAVNISPQQFRAGFAERIEETLQQAHLQPSMLELGLSEGILMDNDSNITRTLEDLREMGVHLSLENFGTSYAPLSCLSRHPLDELKIDRSFVMDCDKREDRANLVKAIIAMAKSLDLRTVAEGVESEGEYRFLADQGIRIMRGYLFSKPVPADTLRQQLLVPWHYMTQIQRMTMTAQMAASNGNPLAD